MLPPAPSDIPRLYKQAMAAQAAGQRDAALALYRRILAARPATPEAHFQIGRLHAEAGDRARAETALRKALALKPAEAAIWQALAAVLSGGKLKSLHRDAAAAGIVLDPGAGAAEVLALVARGQAAAAEPRALALVMQAPGAAAPAHALGAARAAQGKWAGARGPLEKAVERDPANLAARVLLAEAQMETGQWALAETGFRDVRAMGGDAMRPLARLLMDTCRAEEAAELLDAAARAAPKDAALQRQRGQAHAMLRQPDAARAAYDAAIRAGMDKAAALPELAGHLSREGEAEAAVAVLDQALKSAPDHPGLLTQRAQLRQSAGALEEAAADLRRAIARAPAFAEAFRAYTAGGKMAKGDPVVAKLEAQLARPDLPGPARRVMSFAMAKAAADMGRDAEVFGHLDRANRLMREAFPYDFEADVARARERIAEYAARLRPLAGTGPDDPALFVTGLPRSGTTLVETILAAHSGVSAGGELSFLGQALAPLHDRLRRGETPPPADFAAAGARYLAAARRRAGTEGAVTDKAISTFSRIGHAALALPGARFIVLKRDPRDVGLSIYRNMFPEGLHRFATDLRDIGRYIRLFEAMVEAWAEMLPERVHVVEYEALTAEPEPQIRALVAAAGLEWEEACLAPHKSGRRVDTLSFAQVRQPIYRSSVAGWRRFEAELAPLLEGLEERVVLR